MIPVVPVSREFKRVFDFGAYLHTRPLISRLIILPLSDFFFCSPETSGRKATDEGKNCHFYMQQKELYRGGVKMWEARLQERINVDGGTTGWEMVGTSWFNNLFRDFAADLSDFPSSRVRSLREMKSHSGRNF